jgi:hypothetical protein
MQEKTLKCCSKDEIILEKKKFKGQQNITSPRIASAKTSMPCFTEGYNYQKKILLEIRIPHIVI